MDFVTVVKKKYHKHQKKDELDVPYDVLVSGLQDIFSKYCVEAIIIFGSRAKKLNKASSDIDIMTFWKKSFMLTQEQAEELGEKIVKKFNLHLDMVMMQYNPKATCDTDHMIDEVFMDNVNEEGIVILGKESKTHYIYSSVKKYKVKL
uniref:Polymerase beta nucleotidyltransferase domain-containing protein n=1 Tax=viral metagenome TaxID=1070528 RepID=A0A6C0ECM3_9ZZZZ